MHDRFFVLSIISLEVAVLTTSGKPEGAVLARLSVSVSVNVASVGAQFVNVFVYGCVVLRIQLLFETPQFCTLTCVHSGGWALLLPAISW